jgi:hypothetical protein
MLSNFYQTLPGFPGMIHSPINLDLFPADYSSATRDWLCAVDGLTDTYTPFPVTDSCATGPSGEVLLTQTAWIGKPDAPRVLVLIAGTHGIEGFAGTSVQLDFLDRLHKKLFFPDEKIAVLLIHALTPWGYAWHRRCDEHGIDLNRNFVDFSNLPANPGFIELHQYLLDPDRQKREQVFNEFKQRYGQARFEQAISGGQYIDPFAPFYGGIQPNHGHQVINALFEQFQLARRQLAVIDVHTGLGPYAYGEVICDHPLQSLGLTTAKTWYGDAVAVPEEGTSSSVPKQGLLDYAWHQIMRDSSCFVTLEFGTLGTAALFDVLLKDHLVWAGIPADNPNWRQQREQIRKAMLSHFCPHDPVWRETVIFRSRQLIHQAVTGLLQ